MWQTSQEFKERFFAYAVRMGMKMNGNECTDVYKNENGKYVFDYIEKERKQEDDERPDIE